MPGRGTIRGVGPLGYLFAVIGLLLLLPLLLIGLLLAIVLGLAAMLAGAVLKLVSRVRAAVPGNQGRRNVRVIAPRDPEV